MPNLDIARKRYETAEDLLSVVKMMKAMAAANIREYEQAEESLEKYTQGIVLAFRGLLRTYPPDWPAYEGTDRTGTGVIVFGSDQGMCGQFNDRIVQHVLERLDAFRESTGKVLITAVGQRAFDRLAGAGVPVEDSITVPGSPTGIPDTVLDIIEVIEKWSAGMAVSHVFLEYNRHIGGSSYEPVSVRLLPLDREWLLGLKEQPWPTRVLPVYRMETEELFAHLVRHYLIAHLFQAFAESLASENASRLAAMQGAEKNIRDRIVELKSAYHQERQVSITEELLDIISGFNALEGQTEGTR